MRRSFWLGGAAALLCVVPCLTFAGKRPFTVRDSIELSTFDTPGKPYFATPRVLFSPDHSAFMAVTTKGNLASGKRESTIWLFDSAAITHYLADPAHVGRPQPLAVARHASASNRPPVAFWRFSSDGARVLFLGADYDGVYRLYSVSRTGGAITPLSRADQDVSLFGENGGHVVYLAHAPVRADQMYQAGGSSLPDIVIGTGQSLLSLLFPQWLDATFQTSDDELWQVAGDQPTPVTDSAHKPIHLKDARLILDASGNRLITTSLVPFIPKSWERYHGEMDYPGLQIKADKDETVSRTGFYRPKQYELIDLRTGKRTLLTDTPIEMLTIDYSRTPAAFSGDGQQVVLGGAYPRLSGEASDSAVYACQISIVNLKTQGLECLQRQVPIDPVQHPYPTRQQLVDFVWRDGDRQLVAEYATPNNPSDLQRDVFERDASGHWQQLTSAADASSSLNAKVDESLGSPPVVVAYGADGKPVTIFDPNPQLRDIAMASVKTYHVKIGDGGWDAALMLPPDYKKGRRYPLVIQTHNLDTAKYFVDGPSATGFAARAFAGRGMVVLQVDERNVKGGTPEESEAGAAGYRAAVAQLVAEGIADPDKVGITTWSHMGAYTVQALLDQPHAFRAATFSEAAFNSYWEYLMNIDYMGGTSREEMYAAQFGTKPFGKGLDAWVKHSAGFKTDEICTPILFQYNSPAALVYSWDAYATLRSQRKPVDLLFLRNGDHVSVKPAERLVEQGMNVDWFDYWLNGHKDSDPAKKAQYARWDLLHPTSECSK